MFKYLSKCLINDNDYKLFSVMEYVYFHLILKIYKFVIK